MFNGMWMDGEPEAQPQGTYRMAVNAVKEPSEAALSTEHANRLVARLAGDSCGSISIDGEHTVIFAEPGYIYLYNQQTEQLQLLVNKPCLNLSKDHIVTGVYKVINGCERSIYWNDGSNEDRYYNLDKSELFNDCDDFRLLPITKYPVVRVESVVGGILKPGAYSVVVELLDQSTNVLVKTIPSEMVYIKKNNQALRINVENVEASYARISIISYTSGTGVTIDAFEYQDLIPVPGSVFSFDFTGADVIQKDWKLLLTNPSVFETSRNMEVVHDMLLRINVSEKNYDFSEFQKAASKICTRYEVKETTEHIFTEQGDEVKAYGIVYLMKNGTLSPVFHIPGRNRIVSDGEIIPGVKIPVKSTKSISVTFKGELVQNIGGWVLQYQITSPEAITEYFIQLTAGNAIAESTEPSGVLTAIFQQQQNPGLEIPDNDPTNLAYIEIRVVHEGVTFLTALPIQPNYDETLLLENTIVTFIDGPNTVNEKWFTRNTAIKSEKKMAYWQSDERYLNPVNYCKDDYWGVDCDGLPLQGKPIRYHKIPSRAIEPLFNGDRRRYIGVRFTGVDYPHEDVVGHFFVSASGNTVVSSGYMVPYNFTDEGRFVNYLPNTFDNERPSNSQRQNLITPELLVDKLEINGAYVYVNGFSDENYQDSRPEYKKFFRDRTDLQMYGKLHDYGRGFRSREEVLSIGESDHINYLSRKRELVNRSLHHDMNILTVGETPHFERNSANMRYVYVKTGAKVFQSVFGIRYRFMHSAPLTLPEATLFSGDKRITQVDVVNISSIRAARNKNTGWLFVPFAGAFIWVVKELLDAEQINAEYEWLTRLYVETSYDFEEIDATYYFNGPVENVDRFVQSLFTEGYLEEGKRKATLRESVQLIQYDVNKDFGVTNKLKVQYPIPISFDYCSDCISHYPTRISFSETTSQEQQSDAWRVYPPLNYVDLPSHRGALVAANYTGGVLLCRTQRGCFVLQPDPQQINTSGGKIYLGTPEFLAIPAQEIGKDANGYGGQQSKRAHVNTSVGLFWYDEDAGRVFLYNGQINELSRKGMQKFFLENRKGAPLNVDNTLMGYDPILDRVILHRQDLLDEQVYSFTVSYSLTAQAWLSFHSYMPDHMFFLNKKMYTILRDSIYAHDDMNRFCRFYGIDFPFQVGLVYTSMQTQQWHSVHYYAPIFKYEDGLWRDVLDKTFDQAFAYTRKQSSGVVNLVLTQDPDTLINWDERTKTVVQADRNYRIAGLRDISVDDIVVSPRWQDKSQFYVNGQGYQDVVPINVDYTLPQHEQLFFRDKFIQLRLLFTPREYKMLIYIVDFTNLAQVR